MEPCKFVFLMGSWMRLLQLPTDHAFEHDCFRLKMITDWGFISGWCGPPINVGLEAGLLLQNEGVFEKTASLTKRFN